MAQKKTGFDALMQVVCAEWCLGRSWAENGDSVDVTSFIPETGVVTADEFVEWVFLASYKEAGEPRPMWQRARVAIRAAFVQHMGSETVDATALRWAAPDVCPIQNLPLSDPEAFARNLAEVELLDYKTEYGEDSREWIVAKNELARRNGDTLPASSNLLAIAVGLALIAYWAYRFLG